MTEDTPRKIGITDILSHAAQEALDESLKPAIVAASKSFASCDIFEFIENLEYFASLIKRSSQSLKKELRDDPDFQHNIRYALNRSLYYQGLAKHFISVADENILQEEICNHACNSDNFELYAEHASEETKSKIKKDQNLQASFLRALRRRNSPLGIKEKLQMFCTDETLRSASRQEAQYILNHIRLMRPRNTLDSLIDNATLADKNTVREEFLKEIYEKPKDALLWGRFLYLLSVADTDTIKHDDLLQSKFRTFFSEYRASLKDINLYEQNPLFQPQSDTLSQIFSSETLREFEKCKQDALQELVHSEALVKTGVALGKSIRALVQNTGPYDNEKLQEDAFMRKAVLSAMYNYFGAHGANTETFTKKIRILCQKRVDTLSTLELHRALYDKTCMPLGLKFHVRGKMKDTLRGLIPRTGSFVAHEMDTTFVASPLVNTELTFLCIDVLEKYLGQRVFADSPNTDIQYNQTDIITQLCTLHRIPNKSCGFFTIAYLLARPIMFPKGASILKTNQTDAFLTIRDGNQEGVNLKTFFVPTEDPRHAEPQLYGRTDVTVLQTREDARLANRIMTLLVHADFATSNNSPQYLKWHSLGVEFTERLHNILTQHGVEQWLDTVFVNDNIETSARKHREYKNTLQTINSTKQKDHALFQMLDPQFQSHRARRSNLLNALNLFGSARPTVHMDDAEHDMSTRIHNTLTMQVRNLVDEFEQRMYADGYTNEFTEYGN